MKIIVASDSHGICNEYLREIQRWHPDAALYLFCGDLEGDPLDYPGWIMVRGNNDYFGDFVNERIIPCQNHKILLTHSHRYSYYGRIENLASKAKEMDCDIVCYGHTHIADFEVCNGVYVLNPGSLYHSRNQKETSYAILTFTENDIDVEFKYRSEWGISR